MLSTTNGGSFSGSGEWIITLSADVSVYYFDIKN
jgi:hypothetical protein